MPVSIEIFQIKSTEFSLKNSTPKISALFTQIFCPCSSKEAVVPSSGLGVEAGPPPPPTIYSPTEEAKFDHFSLKTYETIRVNQLHLIFDRQVLAWFVTFFAQWTKWICAMAAQNHDGKKSDSIGKDITQWIWWKNVLWEFKRAATTRIPFDWPRSVLVLTHANFTHLGISSKRHIRPDISTISL